MHGEIWKGEKERRRDKEIGSREREREIDILHQITFGKDFV